MSNIEPTEEQRSDAAAFYYKSIQSLPLDVCDWVETGAGCANVDADVLALARLLAEREAKLREVCTVQALQMARAVEAEAEAENDVLREENRTLRAQWLARTEENQAQLAACDDDDDDDDDTLREEVEALRAERDAAQRHFEASQVVAKVAAAKHTVSLHDEIDTLRARVAEMEAEVAVKDEERTMQVSMIQSLRNAREAQHLARIAELEAENDMLRVQAINKGDAADRQRYQHLADIKALLKSLKLAWWSTFSEWQLLRGEARALIRSLAHYDDAKADAPAGPVTGVPATEEERCTRCLEPYSRDNWCAETGHDVPREALGEPDEDDAKAAEGGEG